VTSGRPDRTWPLICATCAVGLAFAWQALTVRFNYAGNWTGLFCTGVVVVPPPELAAENIYRFAGTYGYDGQFYHYVAHDPLLQHGLARHMDWPRQRYARILVPGLAALLAAGQSRHVDAAYISVNLLFLFAGIYWLGRFIGIYTFHPAWAVLYLLAPATVVSLDRLTVDLALVSLAIGFALYVTEDRPREIHLILVLAPLARETGFLFTAAYVLAELRERRFNKAFLFATSAVPALGWYAFLTARTSGYNVMSWLASLPLASLANRMLNPVHYASAPAVALAASLLDELALAGALFSLILPFWLLRKNWSWPLQWVAILMAVGSLNLGPLFWMEAYAFGRILSPLLVVLALFAVWSRSWAPLLPLVMVVPRVIFEMGGQFIKIARGLFT
jgi:hypothetical protein